MLIRVKSIGNSIIISNLLKFKAVTKNLKTVDDFLGFF